MLKEIKNFIGLKVIGPEGELGTIKDFYFDIKSWTVRYALLSTGGWMSKEETLISVSELIKPSERSEVDDFSTKLTMEKIKASPAVDFKKPLSQEIEEAVSDYYGWVKYWLIGKTTSLNQEKISLTDIKRLRTIACSDEEESTESHLKSIKEIPGYSIIATNWSAGNIYGFIVNDESWDINYIIVDTLPWLPSRKVLIHPDTINVVSGCEKKIMVGLDKETIIESPEFDPSGQMDWGEVNKVSQYYHYT